MRRVSIIIPCFNQARYLRTAADSALSQMRDDDEMIVVNDGSTDDTREVCAGFGSAHPARVTVVNQTNQGLSMARQAGLERAQGEYVVFLDADDRLLPEMLESCLAGFRRRPPASAVAGWTRVAYEHTPGRTRILKTGKNRQWPSVLAANPFGACCSLMLRRTDLLAAGGVGLPGVRACEDWDLYARMVRRGMIFHCIPRVLSCYLQHGDALSRNVEAMLDEKIAMLERLAACADAPGLSSGSYARFRNGYVLFALGQAVGQRSQLPALSSILARMVPGAMALRPCCDQFRFGFQHTLAVPPAPPDPASIHEIGELIAARFRLLGFDRYVALFLSEIRREMKHPFQRYSVSRRLSRLLDPARRIWFGIGAATANDGPGHRARNAGEPEPPRLPPAKDE
jgi:hypothetical protein